MGSTGSHVCEKVLLDFVILPEHYGQTKSVDVQTTIGEVQKTLEKELQVPEGCAPKRLWTF